MTRQEASDLFGWLKDSYPRNYAEADVRRVATVIDNLVDVFAHYAYKDVVAEYKRVFRNQKNEPHPSDIRRALKAERPIGKKQLEPDEAYEILRKQPKYAEMEMAYGERACRRAAKLCVETATIGELRFRLDHDLPCTETDYSAEIEAWKRRKNTK